MQLSRSRRLCLCLLLRCLACALRPLRDERRQSHYWRRHCRWQVHPDPRPGRRPGPEQLLPEQRGWLPLHDDVARWDSLCFPGCDTCLDAGNGLLDIANSCSCLVDGRTRRTNSVSSFSTPNHVCSLRSPPTASPQVAFATPLREKKKHTMASLSLSQSNYSAQLESDIADQHNQLNSDDDDLPPRPTSRLGFNSVPAEVVPPELPVVPSRPRKGGRDLLIFPPISQPTPPPTSPPPAVPPTPIAPYAVIPSAAPSPPLSRRTTPVFSPIARPKYSSLPSPLSPASDNRIYYTNPLRHCYGHHGRSRHALLHLKYLWSLREDQWDEHSTRMRDTYAYSGMSPLNAPLPPPPPRHSPPLQRATSPDFVPMPPMTIHPRRGDLGALRDPYCAHMDRCFVGMPLWTMGKTLWMYDVHMLAGHRARVESFKALGRGGADEDGDEENLSEGESMAASMSTAGFSDDSDETLVESESERDLGGRSDDEMLEDVPLDDDMEKEKETDDLVKPPISSLDSRPDYLNSKRALTLDVSFVSSSMPPPRWETSWYKRWEVLLELVRLDTERERAQQQIPADPTSSLAVRPPRFFIGEDEYEGEGDESWSEERWDEVLAMNGDDDVMIVSSSNQCLLPVGA
ncbi:hypothetical protein B0H13DRAFT_1861257 [Mycena leptocephala]|nr:hypothetical protein B0H13DRAFT_1861257 [Mycena leptocephala]